MRARLQVTHHLRTLRSRRPRGQRGSFTFAVIFWALMAMTLAGFVVDGGLALSERQHVGDIAEQAARAGADELDQNDLRAGNYVIDKQAACVQAGQVATASGLDRSTTTVTCDYGWLPLANGQTLPTITVTIQTQYSPPLTGMIYSGQLTVNAHATAHPQPGI